MPVLRGAGAGGTLQSVFQHHACWHSLSSLNRANITLTSRSCVPEAVLEDTQGKYPPRPRPRPSWAPDKADLLAAVAGLPLGCFSGALLLTRDPPTGSGHLSLTPASNWEEQDGLRFPSPSISRLKPSSPAWQAYDHRCSSPSLTVDPSSPQQPWVLQASLMV